MTPRHQDPARSGIRQNGTTPVALDGQGIVSWSLPIPVRIASQLAADVAGRWFLRTPELVAAGNHGGLLWQREAAAEEPCLLDDGSLVVPFREELLALDPANGTRRWSVSGQHVHAAQLPGGGCSAVRVNQRESTLVVLDRAGLTRWEAKVAGSVAPPIGRSDGSIVLASDAWLEAFDADGARRWRASVAGFDVPPGESQMFTTQPLDLDGERVIVGVDGYSWLGFLIVDPARRRITPWPPDGGPKIAPRAPFALRRDPRPLALVAPLQAMLRLIALDDAAGDALDDPAASTSASTVELWTEHLRRPAYACAVDPQGRVAVAYTDSTDLHDPYLWANGAEEMRGRCGVALLEADGRRRWTWDAPGPLGGFAIGAAGEILVSSEGRLWALT
jgi:hypothetical protein